MANALICTVGKTPDVRSDIVDALARDVGVIQPTFVSFLVSDESRPNAERIAEVNNLSADAYEII